MFYILDAYPTENPLVLVAPELTDPSKVQLLHFPNGAMRINSEVDFIIKRNGVKGNFEVKVSYYKDGAYTCMS